MRVLIADDDPVYVALLEDLLTQWHYEVVTASDGLGAWQAMHEENAPKLVILDWRMPGLDGFELCRRVRAEGQDQDDRYIILVTGSRGEEDIMQVLVAGADDYLIKPFEPSDLKVRLRAAMRIMNLRGEVAALRRRLGEPVGGGV